MLFDSIKYELVSQIRPYLLPHTQRLPITPELLSRIHSLWSTGPPSFDRVMLWAAFCLAFFGFLRSGEFTSSPHEPNECILSVNNVSVDSRQNPQTLTVFLSRSKTDQLGTGKYIYLGRTGNNLCPVAAVLGYLSIRPHTPGPLFIFEDGTPLSRPQLVLHLRHALSQLGVKLLIIQVIASELARHHGSSSWF